MVTLDDLMRLTGVVAAGEFTADGQAAGPQLQGRDVLAAMTAQFCGSVTMMFNTLAGAFTQLSGMNWVPEQGWSYARGDYTVAIGGNKGVFVETAKADFNQLFGALAATR